MEVIADIEDSTIINDDPYYYFAEYTTTTSGGITINDYDVFLSSNSSVDYTLSHSDG